MIIFIIEEGKALMAETATDLVSPWVQDKTSAQVTVASLRPMSWTFKPMFWLRSAFQIQKEVKKEQTETIR